MKMGTLISLVVFFAPVVLASTLKPQIQMNLAKYLKIYLSHDEELKNSDLQIQISQSQLDKASDLYQSQLTLGTSQNHIERNSSTIPYERITRMGGSFIQNFASGTSLSLDINKYLESSALSLLGVSADYSLSIHQELLKNSFGSLDREVKTRAESEFRLSQSQHQNQMLKSCYTGIQIFINAYSSQQNLNTFEEILKDSNQTLQFSEDAYKKKMLRKIDILSARADNLRIQSQQARAQKEYQKRISSLISPISAKNISPKLDNPSQTFLRWKLKFKIDPTQSFTYKEREQKLLSTESALKISKNSARHQLDLGFTVGRRGGVVQRSSKILNENYVNLSLTMDWPIFNKTNEATVAQAQYERDIAIYDKQRKIEDLLEQQDHLREDLKLSHEQLQISWKKMKIYGQQIKEAKRLLKAGTLEFEDYIRYRDTYLSERLQSISLQNKLWNIKAQLVWLHNNFTLLCGGKSS